MLPPDYTPDHITSILGAVATIITGITGWGIWAVFKEKKRAPAEPEDPLIVLTRRLDDLQNRLSYVDSRILKQGEHHERLIHELRDMLIEIRIYVRGNAG